MGKRQKSPPKQKPCQEPDKRQVEQPDDDSEEEAPARLETSIPKNKPRGKAHHCPVCKKIPNPNTCKDHFQVCPKHPNSMFAVRELCPKCQAHDRREEATRGREAEITRKQTIARTTQQRRDTKLEWQRFRNERRLGARQQRLAERDGQKEPDETLEDDLGRLGKLWDAAAEGFFVWRPSPPPSPTCSDALLSTTVADLTPASSLSSVTRSNSISSLSSATPTRLATPPEALASVPQGNASRAPGPQRVSWDNPYDLTGEETGKGKGKNGPKGKKRSRDKKGSKRR